MKILEYVNNLLYKDRYVCVVCDGALDVNDMHDEVVTGHTGICLECLGSLPWVDTSLKFLSRFDPATEIFAPLYYEGAVKELMKKFKFEGMFAYAPPLAYVTYYRIDAAGICIKDRYDMIAPVPLSKERLRERGYNQSALIAKELADYFEIEYCENALRRIRNTQKQSLIRSKNERYENVRGAFEANEDAVKGKRVLVFDDIYTYGYTMNECTNAVKNAGAVKTGAVAAALATKGGRMLI